MMHTCFNCIMKEFALLYNKDKRFLLGNLSDLFLFQEYVFYEFVFIYHN